MKKIKQFLSSVFSKVSGFLQNLFKKTPQHELLRSCLEVVDEKYFVSEIKLSKKEVYLKMSPIVKGQEEIKTIPVGNEKKEKLQSFIDPGKELWP